MAVVGQIARPHGIRGQVIVNLVTDFPQNRFRPGAALFVKRGERVEPVTVTTVRFQHDRPVIGIAGVEDMNAALPLAGSELRVPVEDLARLPSGTFYRHDLVGCAVETVDGMPVGLVARVEGAVDGSRLVVDGAKGEVLIPLVAPICTAIEPERKRIVIAPPAGLLDVNESR
jgi:16S rRNA processing protein RimM